MFRIIIGHLIIPQLPAADLQALPDVAVVFAAVVVFPGGGVVAGAEAALGHQVFPPGTPVVPGGQVSLSVGIPARGQGGLGLQQQGVVLGDRGAVSTAALQDLCFSPKLRAEEGRFASRVRCDSFLYRRYP